jgi:hypothetical protein
MIVLVLFEDEHRRRSLLRHVEVRAPLPRPALRLLEDVADDVDVFVPGHGSMGGVDQVFARIDEDRAYVQALRDAQVLSSACRSMARTFCLACTHRRSSASSDEANATPG